MALIKHFRSTTIWKAFLLNSLAATLVIFLAMTIKASLDTYTNKNDEHAVKQKSNVKSVVFTLLGTFAASMLAYGGMYLIFGYGGGMLANT